MFWVWELGDECPLTRSSVYLMPLQDLLVSVEPVTSTVLFSLIHLAFKLQAGVGLSRGAVSVACGRLREVEQSKSPSLVTSRSCSLFCRLCPNWNLLRSRSETHISQIHLRGPCQLYQADLLSSPAWLPCKRAVWASSGYCPVPLACVHSSPLVL